jgi:hypothetical protein
VRRRVFFAGDGDGDAVSVTADFAGLGAGVGSAAKTLASAIKPMAAARSRMCFIIIYIWFVVQVKFLFFAEAWPTKALLRALDQLQHARQIACRFQPHLDKPKTEACSDFFYPSHSPRSDEHLETREVSKKICALYFHTQEITQGTSPQKSRVVRSHAHIAG